MKGRIAGIGVAGLAALSVAACASTTGTTSTHVTAKPSHSTTVSQSHSTSTKVDLAKVHRAEHQIKALSVCEKGRTQIKKFLVDLKPVSAQLDAGAASADTTQLQNDLKPVAQTLEQMDHLATSGVDHNEIESVQHGIGELDAGLNDIQYGDLVSANTAISEGGADIEGFGKLSLCS